ncbi:hypothetical protein Q4S45_02910 [Massilia sp. R2A-15]|uniref:hypothetical protein n=1 Tax=Massilia sp. R2A-15 TaxID=3064278 RepID=UPI00273526E7|nr:hypothetical protein [Massilia sp. R2A-15]WLI90092.1 hypothetical protein Q4S45_02910 [Massilia sp. R2A-15]
MGFDLGSLLQQYAGSHPANPDQAENDFDQVAQNASTTDLAQGVTQAFRSDQTPPFPQMVGQLFGNSDGSQRAGMLNQLIGAIGPGVLSSIAGGALGNMFGGGNSNAAPQITPEQAQQMSPQQVQEIAEKAQQANPSIMDRMGEFYAQHPQLVKGLGGAALAIALGHMAQGMRRN